MSDVDQKIVDPAAPVTPSEGEPNKGADDGGQNGQQDDSQKSELEARLKGIQGSLQKEIEEKKVLEAKLKEYEFEKLSEQEKVEAKLKEAEQKLADVSREKENLAIKTKWSDDWSKLKEEFPKATSLPVIRKKAESNLGALGNPEAQNYEEWLVSVRDELSETEESIGGGDSSKGKDPDVKKINNANDATPSSGDLYKGLSPQDKVKRMRENIGVQSNW